MSGGGPDRKRARPVIHRRVTNVHRAGLARQVQNLDAPYALHLARLRDELVDQRALGDLATQADDAGVDGDLAVSTATGKAETLVRTAAPARRAATPAEPATIVSVAVDAGTLQEQLEEIRAQLGWVRDYL